MNKCSFLCAAAVFAASSAFCAYSLPDIPQIGPAFESSLYGSGVALNAYEAGYKYYLLGDFEKSEDKLKEALHYEPNLLKAHYWLGKLYREMGRLDDAVYHFEEVKRLEKLIKERRIALQIQDNEYPAASRIPKTVAGIKNAEKAYNRGLTLLDGGYWEGAVLEFKKAQSLYPANHKYLLILARTLQDMGQIQAGVGYYRELMMLRDVSFAHFMEGANLMFAAGMDYVVAPLAEKHKERFKNNSEFMAIFSRFKKTPTVPPPAMAKVLKRMDGQVIVNIGTEEGLKLSDEFRMTLSAFRAGASLADPNTGDIVGREPDTTLAELLVTKVYKNTCWALIRKEYGPGVKAGDLIEFKKTIR